MSVFIINLLASEIPLSHLSRVRANNSNVSSEPLHIMAVTISKSLFAVPSLTASGEMSSWDNGGEKRSVHLTPMCHAVHLKLPTISSNINGRKRSYTEMRDT